LAIAFSLLFLKLSRSCVGGWLRKQGPLWDRSIISTIYSRLNATMPSLEGSSSASSEASSSPFAIFWLEDVHA
jgi:hypothetical protein